MDTHVSFIIGIHPLLYDICDMHHTRSGMSGSKAQLTVIRVACGASRLQTKRLFIRLNRAFSHQASVSSTSRTSRQASMSSSTDYTSSLQGKVAIVTGSSRSIGAAIVRRLAEQGASVVVNYVSNAQPADDLVSDINAQGKGRAVAIKGDASTLAGGRAIIADTLKAFGKLDILVLNAGIMGSKPISDIDEAFFDDHVQSNIKGPLFMAKAAIEHLPAPGGRIIFFSSSLTGATAILPNALCYVMSKGAIEQCSRVLAKDLGGRGLTVNTISPGPVDTTLFRAGKPQKVIDMIAAQNPNNRLAQPEDIAPIVAFIASPAAQWINGQNIRANGGFVV